MVRSILILLVGMIFILPSSSQNKQKKLKLWYRQPALQWDHSMPIGNGRLGAMIYGGVQSEKIVLNEESIWSHDGEYTDRIDGYKYVREIRQLLFDGKYKEAEKLAAEKVMGDRLPSGTNTYQELGVLTIDLLNHSDPQDYSRELDLETAIATVRYKIEKTEFTRETFSSAIDQAVYWRIVASDSGKINAKISLQRDGSNHDIQVVDNEIVIRGIAGTEKGVGYCGRIKVIPVNGGISHGENRITVSSADTLLLVITAATDYSGGDPFTQSQKQMELATGRKYSDVKCDHIAEYQSWFNRFSINLGSSQAGYFPTDERLEALKIGAIDPSLISLYVQFSRYLLISSSRPGCLPANLQGIWVNGIKPPWNSDYHININLQMNYWLAEVTNLSECSYPLFDFIEKLLPNGRKTARTLYGSDGFAAHHTSDVWFFTTGFGKPVYGAWPMAGGWLSRHLWDHYLYTQDLAFLKNTAYPIMKEAAEFYLDFLVEDPKTGLLVSGPSISPENSFITSNGERASLCMGPSMDHQIIQDHLLSTVKASELLNADVTFRHEMLSTLDKLSPVKIGKDGRILEWSQAFEEAEPGHRHMSHLYGLHPANLFTWQETPELMEAAKKVLEYRLKHGGGHTGWSRAWIINFYARLKDQEKAYSNVRALLSKSTLPSMLDTHPPFQIDGNFGGCAGIIEMLVQSHSGEIELLPALPDAWKDGEVKGVKARGGFEIDIKWDKGQLVSARIKSMAGKQCRLLYNGRRIVKKTSEGEEFIVNPEMFTDK